MNDLTTIMHSVNVNNNPTPKEIYKIDDVFVVERSRSVNDKEIEVFTDELFKNGVSVLVVHSMETKPEDIVPKYLKMEQEKSESIARQKAYKESAYAERCEHWKTYAQKSIAYGPRFSGSSIINIAELRVEEPEINLFLDEMVRAVAQLYAISYEDAFKEHFKIDHEGKDFVRHSQIEGVDMDFQELAEKIGNLFYDALGSFIHSFGDSLKDQSTKKYEIGEMDTANALQSAYERVDQAAGHIMTAWEICKPYIGEDFPNLKHSSQVRDLNISNGELGRKAAKLTVERMIELLSLLAKKLERDGQADEGRGRKKLSTVLYQASEQISKAIEVISFR